MIIYPAIDLMNGECVRLSKGDFNTSKVYSSSPVDTAKSFEDAGAKWLHVIDLDGTKDPENRQFDVISQITEATDLKIQCGGGVRSSKDIQDLLDAGVSRVIIGSMAIKDLVSTRKILQSFGADKIVLAMDVNVKNRKYHIAISGWQEDSKMDLFGLIDIYLPYGLKHLLCTDISKDGMLAGLNLEMYTQIQEKYPDIRVQASGGVAELNDIQSVKAITNGVIIGKALYENKFTLQDALSEAA